MEEFTDEYKFSYDFMTCVMQAYLPGWHPVSLMPLDNIHTTYFTPNIKRAVKHALDGQLGLHTSMMFDYWFTRRFINMKNFEDILKHLTIEFCLQDFDPMCFLELCSFIAEFAALTYNYGVIGAPQYAIFCITHMLMSLRRYGQFSDTTWMELDGFARNMLLM